MTPTEAKALSSRLAVALASPDAKRRGVSVALTANWTYEVGFADSPLPRGWRSLSKLAWCAGGEGSAVSNITHEWGVFRVGFGTEPELMEQWLLGAKTGIIRRAALILRRLEVEDKAA